MRATRIAAELLFREAWAKVEPVLDQQYDDLQHGRPTNKQHGPYLYAIVYNACTQEQLVCDLLYQELQRWLDASLKERALKPILAKCDPRLVDIAAVCSKVQTSLDHFKRCVPLTVFAFRYLGSYFLKRSGKDSIEVVYLKAFGKTVYQGIKGELAAIIFKEVEAYRDGRMPFDPSALQTAARTFVEVATTTSIGSAQALLQLLATDFAAPYMEALRAAYDVIPLAVDGADADKYIEWADGRLGFELALATDVFPALDCDAVLHTVATALSSRHAREILRGVTVLLEGRDSAHVDQLCIEITDFKNKLCAILEKHIATMENATLTCSLLSAVCALHVKFVRLLQEHGAMLRETCPFASPPAAGVQVFLGNLNAARRNAASPSAIALKSAAELLLDVMTPDAASAFEAEYRAASAAFYEAPALSVMRTDLHWVSRQVAFELAVLPSSTSSLDTMITTHFLPMVNTLATTMAGPLLDAWNPSEFACLCELAKRMRDPSEAALHEMGKTMQKRIVEEGKRLLSDFEGATSDGPLSLEKPLVTSVVELNKKYGKLITERLENAALFVIYRKRGFTEFLKAALKRKDPKPSAGEGAVEEKTSFSEVLATFLDAVMKRELKDVVEHNAEFERLDDLLTVFTYITEKDVFQELYKAKLAKRLLHTTPNEDLEKGFLERLQREMGKSFTHKMEGMLLDRDSTRALAEKFAQDSSSSAGLGVEFEVQVLTEANWPAFKSDNLQPPLSLKRCVEAFTRFYKKSHQTRRLTWINMLGSATLNLLFPKGTKDVTATLHQASVLVLVDEAGQLSVRALAEALGLDAQALKPHIASMYLSKFQLLQLTNEAGEKQATAKTIGDDDYFAMNPEFKHSTRKFRLPAPLAKADGDVNMPPIDDRRKIQIDAAVVRIMKSRKALSYTELQDMTIEMLSKYFIAQPKMVKARVEDLVARDYLKRRDDDPKMFEYLA